MYGSIDQEKEKGLHRMIDYFAARNGASPNSERSGILHILSLLFLRHTALAVDRRELITESPNVVYLARGQ